MKHKLIWQGVTAATLTVGLVGTGTTAGAAETPQARNTASIDTQAVKGEGLKRLTKVRSIGTKCGKKPMAIASGRGKMTLRIDETRSRDTVLSKNISADAEIISVGVGWDVTKSRSITVSGSKEVPKGKYGTLKAYTKYAGKKFNVQEHWGGDYWRTLQTGKKAWKPIGVCFSYKQR